MRIEHMLREKPAVRNSRQAADLLLEDFSDLDHEETWALYLARSGKPIKKMMLTMGTLTSTLIDRRRTLKEALLCDASGIILFHNHPSENLTPSKEDITQTEAMKKACELMELNLIDHIIMGKDGYYSFADEKTLSFA